MGEYNQYKWDSTYSVGYYKFIIRWYNVTNNILTLDRNLNARVVTLASSLVTAC